MNFEFFDRARFISIVLLAIALSSAARAQIYSFPTGANRPDVEWHAIETEHFTIIYHDRLEGVAREAADVAEAIYPVVTGNLRTEIPGRTPLYLSDLDEVANAFAYDDRFMFVWMRGILDDMPLGGVRSSGHAKWLRAVITHEFTHIVIARAVGSWMSDLLPYLDLAAVPRWFNEGTARFMEPDGWTSDLDMVLRVAAVNGSLGYDFLIVPDAIDGTLLYETGHSLVRYMAHRFGDSAIARILHLGRGALGYDFDEGVMAATGMPMQEIYRDWLRSVTALYGAEYAVRPETDDIAPPITEAFSAVTGIRYAPDRKRIAILGGDLGVTRGAMGQRLYLMENDSGATLRRLSDEPGIDDEFSWSPDGSKIVLSKLRRGSYRALLRDLYILDVESRAMRRLTDDASLADPIWSPDGSRIVAVEKRMGRDNLVSVDPATGDRTPLTAFSGDVQIYTPSWSPDGTRIAFSLFDADGARAIAVVDADGNGFRRLIADTANNRYPVWSPDGARIAFTTHAGGVPNLQIVNADGGDRHYITDVAGGLYSVQWLPGSDSVVAISFDARRKILPHLIPAGHRVSLTATPIVLPKHTQWRDASFPLRVPAPDSIPRAAVTEPDGYLSIAHLFPVIPLLPHLAGDRDRSGGTSGLRYGLATLWADPMAKHILFGYADYGSASREWGGELYYLNNLLPFSLMLRGDYSLGYYRTLFGEPYYQRNRALALDADYLIPTPNSLSTEYRFWLGGGYRRMEPWSFRVQGIDSTSPIPSVESPLHMRVPVNQTVVELRGGARFTSDRLLLQAEYTRAERELGSSVGYDRAEWLGSFRYPILGSRSFALLLDAKGAAQWGGQIAQEPVALEDYQLIRTAWSEIYRLMREPANYSVRGISGTMYGDRVLVASAGIGARLPIFERLLPILAYLSPETVIFIETGSAWYDVERSIGEIPFRTSAGIELRTLLLPELWLSGGVARGLGEQGGSYDGYLRFTLGL